MNDYPVQYAVDYPDRDLNRVSTAFRIFTAIPILILIGTITGYQSSYDTGRRPPRSWSPAPGCCSCRPP